MTPSEAAVVLAMTLAVYAPKAVPLLVLSEPDRLGPGVRRWLGYVAPAILAALVTPAIFAPGRRLEAPGWDLAAYLVAGLAAVATRRMLPSVLAGLAVVVLVRVLALPT